MSLLKIVGESGNGIIVAGQLWAGVFILWLKLEGQKMNAVLRSFMPIPLLSLRMGLLGLGSWGC